MSLTAATPHSEEAQGRSEGLRFMGFALGGRTFALPLAQVAEITPACELRKMPHMPKAVEGLLDLRGAVFPVLNLRERLKLHGGDLKAPENIIILELSGSRLGILVDEVRSVMTVAPQHQVPASPLLAGIEGALAKGFLLLGEQVVVLLDTEALASTGTAQKHVVTAITNLERQMDDDLQQLLEMAPSKEDPALQSPRIIPQIEVAIRHTEEEVARVVDRIETMLANTDRAFQGLVLLKQQAALGRLKDLEPKIAELDKIGSQLQDAIFKAMHLLQFQDIARQKLERVLRHIQGLQLAIGKRFRDR